MAMFQFFKKQLRPLDAYTRPVPITTSAAQIYYILVITTCGCFASLLAGGWEASIQHLPGQPPFAGLAHQVHQQQNTHTQIRKKLLTTISWFMLVINHYWYWLVIEPPVFSTITAGSDNVNQLVSEAPNFISIKNLCEVLHAAKQAKQLQGGAP